MKRLCTIFLLTVFVLQTFSRMVVEADYFVNRSYIAKYLCINNKKPQLQCGGKCYLSKKLKQQDKQDQQTSNDKKPKFETSLYIVSTSTEILSDREFEKKEYFSAPTGVSSNYHHSVFRPPVIRKA
ncbi:hypothetical protein [Segetibacter sp.]|jgi:hypothetical protein|uniref:hypothetical protein n=1 Tax=Segetibacter sp. TaxID=2231182 RepID=UPI0026247FA0|nr:hypothetical protein [Segetibacter sp.]MCW3080515.1 hypothetical protein [Segetibacter sp.]